MPCHRVQDRHYGWIIVAALSVTETISWGILYYGFPVFLRAMEADLRASTVAVTGALSLALGVAALAALPVGRWIDHRGPRALMTAGSGLGAGMLLAWSRVGSLHHLYVVWGMMGIAMACTLYEPAFATVVQWFARHRDRALLIVTLAAGLASTIFMPLEGWLLARFGWRRAVEILAFGLAATTIPIHALVLRPAPPHVSAEARGADRPSDSIPLRAAMSTGVFWALAGAFAVSAFATVAITVHLIPYLIQRGYAPAFAAVIVGWIGAMQLLGRALFAPVAAWLGPRTVTASTFLVQGGAIALLAVVARVQGLIPVIALLGAANGMSTLARASSVAEVFGRRHYGSISGAIAIGANGSRALAPVGAALLQVWLGGYTHVFWTLAGALILAGLAVLVAEFSPAARQSVRQ